MSPIFRRKSGTVNAIQWTGDNLRAVQEFMFPYSPLTQTPEMLAVRQGGGLAFVHIGEWILPTETPNNFNVLTGARFAEFFEAAGPQGVADLVCPDCGNGPYAVDTGCAVCGA